MIFVTYKIQDGEHEYFDYSWLSNSTYSAYYAGIINDKILIEEVYGGDAKQEEETNTYFIRDWDMFVKVYSVKDITPKELNILDKFGVVSKG